MFFFFYPNQALTVTIGRRTTRSPFFVFIVKRVCTGDRRGQREKRHTVVLYNSRVVASVRRRRAGQRTVPAVFGRHGDGSRLFEFRPSERNEGLLRFPSGGQRHRRAVRYGAGVDLLAARRPTGQVRRATEPVAAPREGRNI